MALGRKSFIKWQNGKRPTRQQQIDAHCYECNGLSESSEDCKGEKSCPLYPYSPSAQRRGLKGGYVPSRKKRK